MQSYDTAQLDQLQDRAGQELERRLGKLLEVPRLLKTPIVRNGRQATVGYCPEIWKDWS